MLWPLKYLSLFTNMTHLDHALAYLKKGWSVIPIKPSSKLPYIASWKEYQTRLPTQAELKMWWKKNPKANIALVCGKISGIIVVDIDPKSGGTTEGLNLPATLCSRTGGGGQHIFYKWNSELIGAKVGIKAGIDIRSEASYVVLPPSLHASGNTYEWINDDEPADPPAWLYKKAEEKGKTDWEAFFAENKGKGVRNMSATQLAGKIINEISPEMWDTLGWPLFMVWNRDHNIPSLPEKELKTIWNSIKKTHIKNNPAPAKKAKEAKEEGESEDPNAEQEEMIVKEFVKNKTKGTFYLARYLTQKFNIITVGEKEREMFVYRGGMYKRAENEVVYPEIQRILGEHITKNAKTETFHKIADMTSHPRTIFDSAPLNLIPLANGVYDFNEDKLLPHASEYRFTYQFPVQYDPQAECPLTYTFMNQVLTPEQYTLMQEWIGYYFYRLYSFKKAIILVGEGDTGKTTLLEVIINMLGKENVSSVSLHKMSADKFAAAHLYEKHGNIVDELSARDISDTGNFKIATGGGSISGEYKFGNQFKFQNFAKFTFACNRIPDVTDFDDEAYFNRWMVLRFKNPIENKIPNFIKQLTTEEERSGLFNLAMIGLRRLLEEGRFSYDNSAIETKIEMMKSGSSIAIFTAEQVEQSVGFEMSKADMYDAYTTFCAERGLSAETMDMFGKKFLFYVSYASEGLIYDTESPGKRVRGWRNVKIKPTAEKAEHERKLEAEFNSL